MTTPAGASAAGVPLQSIDVQEPDWAKIYRTKADREIASAHWQLVVAELNSMQTLSVANAPSIKRLVMFNVEFERASRNIARAGVIRKAVKTKVPQIHPEWSVMKQAADAAASIEAELAISPRRRNNGGKVQSKKRTSRPADAFLKPPS